MEDREIVALYWQPDQRAIAETAESIGPYCLAIASRILADPEDARECVNDAYLRSFDQEGTQSYDQVTDHLIAWYLANAA